MEKLTNQQKEDLKWIAEHKAHILARNKILKYIGLTILWLGISIANYYLLNAANITTLANGIIAFGFEIGLSICIISGYLKVLNKRLESDFTIALASIAFAIAITIGFAEDNE